MSLCAYFQELQCGNLWTDRTLVPWSCSHYEPHGGPTFIVERVTFPSTSEAFRDVVRDILQFGLADFQTRKSVIDRPNHTLVMLEVI